jgi:tRNA C32,U32 (ribose-2'-O)-methylase TrmJ
MSTEDIQTIIKNVESVIQEDQSNKDKEQSSQPNPYIQMKNYFQRKYPTETEDQIMLRTLEHMKQQF